MDNKKIAFTSTSYHYEFYNDYGCHYFAEFVTRNPEFATDQFRDFVADNNRGDRDHGEIGDIAKHEILRLAYEFTEYQWRFPLPGKG